MTTRLEQSAYASLPHVAKSLGRIAAASERRALVREYEILRNEVDKNRATSAMIDRWEHVGELLWPEVDIASTD